MDEWTRRIKVSQRKRNTTDHFSIDEPGQVGGGGGSEGCAVEIHHVPDGVAGLPARDDGPSLRKFYEQEEQPRWMNLRGSTARNALSTLIHSLLPFALTVQPFSNYIPPYAPTVPPSSRIVMEPFTGPADGQKKGELLTDDVQV